ncbi:MAG: IS21-like element helper ATPase IstB [Steroidobacteraceae bacterium]
MRCAIGRCRSGGRRNAFTPSIETLKGLKLHGMATAFEEQLHNPSTANLAFEERFGLLVDRERLQRENGRTTRLLRQARLKHSQAAVEDINYRSDRKLDKRLIATLATGEWIHRGQGLLMTGKTGTGKSWLFCALARQACRQGRSVRYWRLARLLEQLRIAHADGSYMGLLKKIAKTDLIALDDWGLTPTTAQDRAHLLEVLDDRVGEKSTAILSQLLLEDWHTYLGEPTLADAILDRLVHRSHRLALTGPSMRDLENGG